MYPNSALPAGEMALFAVIPVLCLAIWLIGVFIAARPARHTDAAAGTTPLPQHAPEAEKAPAKAA